MNMQRKWTSTTKDEQLNKSKPNTQTKHSVSCIVNKSKISHSGYAQNSLSSSQYKIGRSHYILLKINIEDIFFFTHLKIKRFQDCVEIYLKCSFIFHLQPQRCKLDSGANTNSYKTKFKLVSRRSFHLL